MNEGSLQRAVSLAVQASYTMRAQSVMCKKQGNTKEWEHNIVEDSFIIHKEGRKHFLFFFNRVLIGLGILLLWNFEKWNNTVLLPTFVGQDYVVKLDFIDSDIHKCCIKDISEMCQQI